MQHKIKWSRSNTKQIRINQILDFREAKGAAEKMALRELQHDLENQANALSKLQKGQHTQKP